jgi:acyl carrier protein phosphodiesterase
LNHLFHLFLSDPDPPCRLGALLGDYVKGPLDERFPAGVRRGIAQHRSIDRFAETSPPFRRSKRRLNPALRHCRGILVDVAYDHFLARDWHLFHPQPLEDFATSFYRLLQAHRALLPPTLQTALPRMIAADWLVACRDLDHIEGLLQRLAGRLSRPNLLAGGRKELLKQRRGLEADFLAFMVDARRFLHPPTACPSR